MNIFNEIDIRKKLDENLVYMENIDNDLSEDEVINFFIECLDYCNKLSLYDYKEKIKEKVYELGYKDDIRLELGLNNPYLYVDNDDYSNNEYFVGKFRKDIINSNKEFSYKFQYDKYKRNGIYLKTNKQDVDYVIRNYKNILLNTTNEELYNLCLDRIYQIYKNNSFIEILDKDDIEIIEYNTEEIQEDLVSIIILSYNNDDYIEDTIKSIYEQTYKNIELIIADDCSKNLDIDKFKYIISKYNNENIRKVIIYKSKINLGTVSNCNKAVSLSSGKFIQFIGSDDMLYNYDTIEILVNDINIKKADVLVSRLEWNDINMNKLADSICPVSIDVYDLYGEIISDSDLFLSKILFENLISAPAVFFKRDVFNEYSMFDEKYLIYEDYPYWVIMAFKKYRVAYKSIASIKYRAGSGVSTTGNSLIIKEYNIFKKHREKMIKEQGF